MTEITMDGVASAVVVVVMMLIIISLPSIVLTVRGSSVLLKRYMRLRAIDKDKMKDVIPDHMISELENIKSPLGYMSLVIAEIEKLDSLRPAFFQAELAILLSIILAIFPGYNQDVLILVIVLDIVCAIAIIYGRIYTSIYKQEYTKILESMDNEEAPGLADGMYG